MRRWIVFIAWMLCLGYVQTVGAAPRQFQADYELYRNGKLMGSSKITLSKTRRGYQFETFSQSEGGWASLVGGAQIKETSEFAIVDNKFQAQAYSYRQSVSLKKRKRDISFDWVKNAAREDDGENVVSYLLSQGTLDRNLVVLALAESLKNKTGVLSHMVAYKGEASVWNFKNVGVQTVATKMGNISAIKLDRVRDNKGRSTASWHAEKYDFLPVKIEQIEPDGERIEMRLKAITLGSS
jgi:hypothetical protein